MLRRLLIISTLVFYTLIVFGAGYWLGQSAWPLAALGVPTANVPPAAEEVFDPFWEVWNLVEERYFIQPLDAEMLMEGAIDGLLATLDDPNTRYLPPETEEAARENMEGEIEGIGVLVEMVDGNITIVSPFEGSPAEAAGLKPGDILREADGVELGDMDLSEAAQLIRGPAGTEVELLVQRGEELFSVSVTRDVIKIPSVRGELLDENVAYVRLSRFGNRTTQELEETLSQLLAEEPAGLILDLRNNPGGGLNTAIDVADQFLDEGTVLVERFGDGDERIYESDDGGLAEEIPMVVLINEGSASASEVLAGAIRDRERGIIIGQTSFGKGTVQSWHALSNGGGVRITVARWLTPDGIWVNEDGLEPDWMVALPETAEQGEDPEDTQLQTAIDYLTGDSLGNIAPARE